MSARDALFRDIWDMRSTEEKNALIDTFAHALAQKQRAWLDAYIDELGETPKHQDDITEMIELIDPHAGPQRPVNGEETTP